MGHSSWRDFLPRNVAHRAWEVLRVNWHLGFTSFGGPPVHFKILNDKFVKKMGWIDEQMFQELFSISQALSGPASTKMLYCINLIHGGTFAALLSLLIWSLPGAIAMYGLSIGVSNIGETLPRPAYALLSGLNAATVGVIALAAVELSQKAITDRLTRILVFFSASAGMLYNALWYFPLLMVITGCATTIFDYRWIHRPVTFLLRRRRLPRTGHAHEAGNTTEEQLTDVPARGPHDDDTPATSSTRNTTGSTHASEPTLPFASPATRSTAEDEPRIVPRDLRLSITWKAGTGIIGAFLAIFVTIMVLRSTLHDPPLPFRLFANMCLAGTIIFGGGPVVIPLLREYVVAEGWVSPRDFLIGLAVVQALPGPNFNFAVFLGGLAATAGSGSGGGGAGAAVVAWLGIFGPGMVLVHGTMGIWTSLRGRRWVRSVLRGVNAGAVGLIYTAVYRIWQVGYLDEGFEFGRSLGDDPWWLVVAATSYVGGCWFGVKAPVAILLGAALGLIRYAIVSA